ncbi:MAG: hypothetical protein CME36_09675 [unclassified Hahellaceae]|nr:hypothetical protein [Hahellaceae bacterium]|tara:strand:- start:41919 stop:42125 length:207 start_codon:yes stop_codon:yes gene_type:complete
MAYTDTDIQAVEDALKSGALRVKYADREVTYRSQAELFALLRSMRESLQTTAPAKTHTFKSFSRGYQQ